MARRKLIIPWSLPYELQEEIESWNSSCQSSFSFSFYSCEPDEKDWNKTPLDCIRISDHWNYEIEGVNHSVTDIPVYNTSNWTLARWNGFRYAVIASIPRLTWNQVTKSRLDKLNASQRRHLNNEKKKSRLVFPNILL